MTTLSENLLKEWNAKVIGRLNPQYVLDSSKATLLEEVQDSTSYSRIHRCSSGSLVLEERQKGSMYPTCFAVEQDFSELEKLLADKKSK